MAKKKEDPSTSEEAARIREMTDSDAVRKKIDFYKDEVVRKTRLLEREKEELANKSEPHKEMIKVYKEEQEAALAYHDIATERLRVLP